MKRKMNLIFGSTLIGMFAIPLFVGATSKVDWIPEKDKVYFAQNTREVEIKKANKVNLGEYKLTAYCACEHCCGKSDGITATGTIATAGQTIAVDPNIIPYGTEVVIGDNVYIAEDCGGAIKGNRIDIYFDSHQEALEFGVQYENVYSLDWSD